MSPPSPDLGRAPAASPPLLVARGLVKSFRVRGSRRRGRRLTAIDRVGLTVERGSCVALVGESGCGKTTLGRLLIRLLEPDAGTIDFDGVDLLALPAAELRVLRRDLQMVFQHSGTAFDPRQRVLDILVEPLRIHRLGAGARAWRCRALELLSRVRLDESLVGRHAHQLSGGQRQRLGIARALATEPRLLVLDEPVAALDLGAKARILNLLAELSDRLRLAMVFISHDLTAVRRIADRVMVLYLGRMIESASRHDLFTEPLHPYTAALLSAAPVPDPRRREPLVIPRGEIPSPLSPPAGCRFHPRCPIARPRCHTEEPQLRPYAGREVACHYPGEVGGAVKAPAGKGPNLAEHLIRNDVG